MSANYPKRTLSDRGPQHPLSQEVGITTCTANGPSGHASSCDHRPNRGPSPSYRPNRGPIQGPHRHSAAVPSGHANSVAPIARPSYYRCLRSQPQEAGGSVPLGSYRNHPQKLDPQFRPQIVCATLCHPIFPWLIRSSSRSLETTGATDQLKDGTSCSINGRSGRNGNRVHTP